MKKSHKHDDKRVCIWNGREWGYWLAAMDPVSWQEEPEYVVTWRICDRVH